MLGAYAHLLEALRQLQAVRQVTGIQREQGRRGLLVLLLQHGMLLSVEFSYQEDILHAPARFWTSETIASPRFVLLNKTREAPASRLTASEPAD